MRVGMRVDRRRFLGRGLGLGLGAAVLGPSVLAACGSSGSDSDSSGSGSGSGDDAGGDTPSGAFVLVKRWDDTANTAGRIRLPLSLADPADMSLLTGTSGPATVTGRVVDANGATVTTFDAGRHADGLANPYWPINLDMPATGLFTLLVDGGDPNGLAFQLFEPGDVGTPITGAALPPFDTPTVDDHRGVEPYCTLTPSPCPFHTTTLTDALRSGKHVVYMVGTPAHCQFGTCAPGLESLVAVAPSFSEQAVFVHADVYTDDTAQEVAPAVSALNLNYEPVIYITDTSGAVTDRIDVVWDRSELEEILRRNLD